MNPWRDQSRAGTGADATAGPSHPHLPGVWSGIGTVVLYFALMFGFGLAIHFAVQLAVGFGYSIHAAAHHLQVTPAAVQQLTQQPAVRVSATALTLLVTAGVMLWLIHRHWRSLWAVAQPPGIGITWPRNPWYLVGAIAIGVAAAFLGGMLAHALAGSHAPKQDVDVWAQSVSTGVRLPLAVATVCAAPLVEEAIFRGVLLSGLMRRMRVGWAVLLSALIFGCAHLPDFQFAWYPLPTLVLFGLLLAWLRLRSRSLWPAVAAHATNNFIGVLLAWFLLAPPHP